MVVGTRVIPAARRNLIHLDLRSPSILNVWLVRWNELPHVDRKALVDLLVMHLEQTGRTSLPIWCNELGADIIEEAEITARLMRFNSGRIAGSTTDALLQTLEEGIRVPT